MRFYCKEANKPLFDKEQLESKEVLKIEDADKECSFLQVYSRRRGYTLVSQREYFLSAVQFRIEDTYYIVAHSVNHPDYPEKGDAVRSIVDFVINEFKPGDKGAGCSFTRCFRAQPKGMVP